MAHDPRFDSAWLKWAWGARHAQALEHDITAWENTEPNPIRRVRADYHPKRHGFAVVIEDIEPIPVRWQLLIGDIANNYRAALDHLAWALVGRGKTPPESGHLTPGQEKAVYFPLCKNRSEYNAAIRVPANAKSRPNLPGVRLPDSAIVRRAQPYHHSRRSDPADPFLLMASINAGDKHRTIQPLWAHPTRLRAQITNVRNFAVRGTEMLKRRGEFDVDQEVALIPGRRLGSNPSLDVELDVATFPTLDNRISVREWHAKTGIGIFKLLREFSDQPATIHELGVEWAPVGGK